METPGELLSQFYLNNNLEADGGQSSARVKIEISRSLHFYFPNFDARRKAVIKHDIHHILTGYSASSLAGESEISAWEIASGCKTYWAAFMIDTSGLMMGLIFNFRRTLNAFARGRRTKNLYSDLYTDEKALNRPVAELQKELLLDRFPIDTKPTIADVTSFFCFVCFGILHSLASFILFPLIVLYTLYCWVIPEK